MMMASTAPSSPSSSYSHSPSPTSTSRTSPPPSRQDKYAQSTTAKDHLTTLPPELLLAVISHLPSSKSLLPLSQTNIYLQTFILNTHASTICNTFITTRYSKAASILSATYRDGWYLPTHETVLGTEHRLDREQIRKTGCACSDCRAFLHSASSSEVSLASDPSTHSCLKLLCFPTSPSRNAHSQTICKAKDLLDSPWKLSLPGPMFLVFLERYDWEIQTRHIMLELECKDADETTRQEEERRFNFLVGNYSVRRFLEDVERGFNCQSAPEKEPEGQENRKSGVGHRLGGSISRGWARGRRMFHLKTHKSREHVISPRDSTPPLFGEIRPLSDVFMVSSKYDRSLITGLLWYYGLQNSPPRTEKKATSNGTPKPDARESQPRSNDAACHEKIGSRQQSGNKNRDCMTGLKRGVGHVNSRMKLVFRRCKQVGAFQSLDG